MSQDAKLRLCPLCGSDKIKVDTLSDDCFKSGWWLVWCDQKQGGCSDASITRKTKEEAIFGWNNFHCWKLLAEKEKEIAEVKVIVEKYSALTETSVGLTQRLEQRLEAERTLRRKLAGALESLIRAVELSGNNRSATLEDVKLIVDMIVRCKESLESNYKQSPAAPEQKERG